MHGAISGGAIANNELENWGGLAALDLGVGALEQSALGVVDVYSGHSFRAGGATDLFSSGYMSHAEIMDMGRWKSLAAALIYFRAGAAAARKGAQVFGRAAAKHQVRAR